MFHIVEVLVGFLLHESDLLYGIVERLGAAVENRNLGAVDLYKAVVHAACIKGRHSMLYGAYGCVAFADNSAAHCRNYIFGQGVDYRLSFKIGALDFISVIIGSGTECGYEVSAGMKAFAFDGKTVRKSDLLHKGKIMIAFILFVF